MGRKSRIARGLDIGAVARKMLEKALGVALTDDEYWDLQRGKLTLEDLRLRRSYNQQAEVGERIKGVRVEVSQEEETYYGGTLEELLPILRRSASWQIIKMPPEVKTVRAYGMARAIDLLGKERVKRLLENLYEMPMSIAMIASYLNVGYGTVHRYFRILTIPTRPPRRPLVFARLTPLKELEGKRRELDAELKEVYYLYPDPDLCYVVGFIIGDGSVSAIDVTMWNTEFGLLPPIRDMASRIAKRLNVGFSEYYYDREGREVETVPAAYTWRLIIHTTGLARLISTEKEGLRKDLIYEMLKADRIGYFLAGLWDADGSVLPPHHVYLSQSESNKPLLESIKDSLNKLNIPSSIFLTVRAKDTAYSMALGRIFHTKEDEYRLLILAKGIPKWIELVGHKLLHPEKREKILEMMS